LVQTTSNSKLPSNQKLIITQQDCAWEAKIQYIATGSSPCGARRVYIAMTNSSFVVFLFGIILFVLTATSTGRRRKRGLIGPRALQARLVTPIAISLVGMLALAITEVPFLQGAKSLLGALLLITMAVSSATVPFVLAFWVVFLALAKWTNVLAASLIFSMAVAAGHIVGFQCGSRTNER